MKYFLLFNVQTFNKLLISLFIGLTFFFGVRTMEAASTINYQGTLKSSSQTTVPDTSYTFTFKLYTQSSGGSAVWTETQSLSTQQGVFSAQLGSISAFPSNLFSSNPTLYLGITVNSDSEMTPRQRVGSSPYALVANDLVPTNAATTRANLGISFASNSEAIGNNTPNRIITAWGDSLTVGAGGTPYPTQLSTLFDGLRTVNNKGVGAQTSTQIAVRQGGVIGNVTVAGNQIPASGGVTVTFSSGYEPVTSQGPGGGTAGTISGVPGVVTLSGAIYTFTRTSSGSTVNLSGAVPFIVDPGNANSGIVVIWAGRNNNTDPTQIKSDIAAMVSSLGHTRYFVLSVLNASNEPSGSNTYNRLIQLNNELAGLYGSRYIDVRAYLISHYNSSLPQDVTDHNNDVVPTSLSYDGIHLNTAGYGYVAQAVYNAIQNLESTASSSQSLIVSSNLQSVFASPYVIGSALPNAAYFSKIGIGTTSAASKLTITEVAGRDSFTGTASGIMSLSSGGNSKFAALDFANTTGIPESRIASIRTPQGSNLYFGTSNNYNNGITTTGMIIDHFGAVGIGGTPLTGFGGLDVASGNLSLLIGADNASSARTNLVNKTARIGAVHWNTSEEPMALITAFSDAAPSNRVGIGGGTSIMNAATQIDFYTGANATTTGGTSRMTVNNSGNVGIGNTGPGYLLHVGSGTPAGIVARFQNSTGTCDINPTSTSLSCSSDEILKENIVSIFESSLEKIKQLNPVTYSWKNDENHTFQTGFIAQQVKNILPNLVSEDKDTHLLSLNYIGFIPYIIKSMQEIATKIDGFAQQIITEKAYIKELCVGTADNATCLTKTQIDTLLQQSGNPSTPTPTPQPEPTNEETETPIEEPTSTSEEESEASEEQPVETPQSTETPVLEESGN